jgi:hypothetical protein
MELHIQKCQHCGSRNLRNILSRQLEQRVYVQCRDCKQLVARYVLAKGGYHHVGKGFESFLRSVERDGGFSSARSIQSDFDSLEQSVKEEFDALLSDTKEKYGDDMP